MQFVSSLMMLLSVFCLFVTSPWAKDRDNDFSVWLETLRIDARSAGVSQESLNVALDAINEPLPRVIELDRNQPEFNQSMEDYVANRVSEGRVANGSKMMTRYPTWLGRVEKKYKVQRRFIVALWGIESNYGEHTGDFPVIQSLATLAYDGRRSTYFRKELLEALHIFDAGHIRLTRMRGSWAGAMGQCQFMPSSFRRYAVDADGDGRMDIWTSVPDVLASAANYLKKAGWQDDQTWGRPVRLPEKFDFSLVGLEARLSLARWQSLGVRRSNGTSLPRRNLKASLIMPDGQNGPAYLVYDNYRVLLAWNKSDAFAVAVGTLSDRLVDARKK